MVLYSIGQIVSLPSSEHSDGFPERTKAKVLSVAYMALLDLLTLLATYSDLSNSCCFAHPGIVTLEKCQIHSCCSSFLVAVAAWSFLEAVSS